MLNAKKEKLLTVYVILNQTTQNAAIGATNILQFSSHDQSRLGLGYLRLYEVGIHFITIEVSVVRVTVCQGHRRTS